ncbi:arginase family protein [Pantoea cypripedii]|uniref:Arginase n=1 Tax=Pantoea cypripedii TaxID=55209 RepID=A0A1X1EGC6_PANCY|nr:arginase family protein [Pantoea cypripedii]MBP2199755.1 arginase [Pantoea cypripedii]ORM87976.1 arginase [Pantoea cypripedii]
MKKIILVPSNLGLNPLRENHIPGTFKAPDVLMAHGLGKAFAGYEIVTMSPPEYSPFPEPGTDILNGHKLRELNIRLAAEVSSAQNSGLKPIVIGGDCAILPGALVGSRQLGPVALVHIDGHSDFRHPGNWNRKEAQKPAAAAGMDLALVTGRGEAILTRWPGIEGPLVPDRAVIQLGERESLDEGYVWADIFATDIERMTIFDALKLSDSEIITRIYRRLNDFPSWRYWIHLDMDVLDQSEISAVDSPGSPGLTSQSLTHIGRRLFENPRCCGITVTIYDPDLDPSGQQAQLITRIISQITRMTSLREI